MRQAKDFPARQIVATFFGFEAKGRSMGRRMLLCGVLVSACALPVSAAEILPKPVSKAWFPRFSPDGRRVASAHGSWEADAPGEVHVWDAATGDERILIPQPRGVRSVAWSPKGTFLVTGNYGGDINFYEAATGKQLHTMRPGSQTELVLVTPDEKRVVTLHGTGSVILWDATTKKQMHKWNQVHNGGIWGAALSADGRLLATAGQDAMVRVFDIVALEVRHELPHPASTNGLAFAHDGKILATGCGDALIRLFELPSGRQARELKGHPSGSVTDLQFSADDRLLVSAGMDRTARVWKFDDDQVPELQHTLRGHQGFVFGVALSPDDQSVVTAGWDGAVKLWSAESGAPVWSHP